MYWMLGWLVCGFVGYVWTRANWRAEQLPWLYSDRRFFLVFYTIIGPVAILASAITWFGVSNKNDKPAKW